MLSHNNRKIAWSFVVCAWIVILNFTAFSRMLILIEPTSIRRHAAQSFFDFHLILTDKKCVQRRPVWLCPARWRWAQAFGSFYLFSWFCFSWFRSSSWSWTAVPYWNCTRSSGRTSEAYKTRPSGWSAAVQVARGECIHLLSLFKRILKENQLHSLSLSFQALEKSWRCSWPNWTAVLYWLRPTKRNSMRSNRPVWSDRSTAFSPRKF